ncbi:MAG: tetratricopeptide repeat protein [Flavobacteriales bacterium]|jgi:tetratricopeptide (TPR) repeat protein
MRSVFYILSICVLGWGSINNADAQTDLELAEFYYNEGSFEQAKLYLVEIYKKNKTNAVYQMYYKSLLEMGDFEEAESLIKTKIRRTHKNSKSNVYVDLGSLYLTFEMNEDAREAFDKALELLQPGRSQAVRLANAFIKLDELELAYATYTKAQSLGTTDFHYEFANLQGMRRDFQGMVESFLELLHTKPNYLVTVQNSLNRNLRLQTEPDNGELVRIALLRAAKKYPEDNIYPEMLVWHFTQKKDFASAFIHARAIDLRVEGIGLKVMGLGNTAAANKDLKTAIDCYEYVASKGKDTPYFYTARNELLQVRFHSLTKQIPLNIESLEALAVDYSLSIEDLGVKAETAIMLKNRAHLLAFFLGRGNEAIELMEEVLAISGLNERIAAACKLELGDIYVFEDFVWDASLVFSQVILDFKDDPLGHEAKYRNARISYFTGDFAWAQTQLDALKASTSKLISNDAIDLSLLITDNFNLDTIFEPMEMYARADLLIMQRKNHAAVLTLDTLLLNWPGHSLEDEILMVKGDLAVLDGDIESAVTFYTEVTELHFDDITGDDAFFKLAELYDYELNNIAKAKELYEKIIFEYSGSLNAIEARKRFREINANETVEQ